MKHINKEELSEFIDLFSKSEEFKPVIHAAMHFVESYSEELQKYPKALNLFIADCTIDIFKRYMDSELFSKEEAILLTINQKLSLKQALDNLKRIK